jgi:hypothetical protein
LVELIDWAGMSNEFRPSQLADGSFATLPPADFVPDGKLTFSVDQISRLLPKRIPEIFAANAVISFGEVKSTQLQFFLQPWQNGQGCYGPYISLAFESEGTARGTTVLLDTEILLLDSVVLLLYPMFRRLDEWLQVDMLLAPAEY